MPASQTFDIIPFAEHLDTLKLLYAADDDFKTLWDDYCTSKINSEKYKSKSIKNMLSGLEYQQLAIDLEKEILEYLKEESKKFPG